MYFKTIAIPGMELPVTIVNGFQPLTTVTGISNSGFAEVHAAYAGYENIMLRRTP